ncbi:putative zinc-binding metallopeptidase [Niabella sp. CC-SYL272]|uniref:substrate import-associated zinc metallohydrolase lipoprotein n=1 Tax=Niabella agricola TaxID=2891571 RepID=UPI001F44E7BA|nr:substrate import-associated zinc metallohydrolase lipoprotein [Niabella agricola]MCF3110447.1 putative zinc-binding metallopeptidase [Niabella agricola]
MKKIENYIWSVVVVAALLAISSCRKDDTNLKVDMNDYPQNITPTNEIDTWLNQQFTIPWNILVQYRFERSKQSDDLKNVSPVDLDKIKPMMQVILDNFIGPYQKVAGNNFGKTYFHKEWVLFGSPEYNSDNSATVGTSSNARTMVLYDLNRFTPTDPDLVLWYTHVVYHEFTHALNQTIPIPPAYARVSAGDYDPDWTKVKADTAYARGFISPYGGSAFTEDFAEMLSYMLVEGPIRYSNILNKLGSGSVGYTRLKEKEAIIYDYMKNNFNVDIYALQAEIQKQLKGIYSVKDPEDISLQFPFQLAGNKVNTITVDTAAAHYTTYGSSAAFNSLYSNFRTEFRAAQTTYDIRYLQFVFTSASTMTFRIAFATSPTATTVYASDYYMAYTVDPVTGITRFTKTQSGGLDYNGNGGNFGLTAFEKVMLPYLTNRTFIAAYLPATVTPTNPLYKTFAGFYVNGTPANYFYGPVTYK